VHNIDEERIGTISAALFGLANTAAQEFEKDEAQYVLIKCNRNYIAMFRAGVDAELFVDFKDNANIEDILKECIIVSKLIAQLIAD
jgi:predicted regulator of Ras-like GTPase activity (Roadblock/LC7/MglB family)